MNDQKKLRKEQATGTTVNSRLIGSHGKTRGVTCNHSLRPELAYFVAGFIWRNSRRSGGGGHEAPEPPDDEEMAGDGEVEGEEVQ